MSRMDLMSVSNAEAVINIFGELKGLANELGFVVSETPYQDPMTRISQFIIVRSEDAEKAFTDDGFTPPQMYGKFESLAELMSLVNGIALAKNKKIIVNGTENKFVISDIV